VAARGRGKPGPRRPRTASHLSLRRLLGRKAATELVSTVVDGQPGGQLALVETDGTAFVGGGDWLTPLAARLQRALSDAPADVVTVATGLRLHPLRAGSHLVGGLVIGELADARSVGLLRSSLAMILDHAQGSRDLRQETLDRYREINVLYRLGETIGATLDTRELPALLLAEADRAIEADAAAVLIGAHRQAVIAGSLGEARIVTAMVEASRELIDEVIRTGQPRIVTSPAIGSQLLGAVLCVPIRAQEKPIGAVVLGRRVTADDFSAGDEKLILAIATEGGVAYDRALLHEERIQRERVEEELSIGRRIQLSLLPSSLPVHPGWEFAAMYRAARQVGGDFYDFIELAEAPATVNLVIGDVTGKGVPAALLMASARAVLRASSVGASAPSTVLERTNGHMLRDGRARLFVTALYATLELESGRLAFASGGHDPPLWVRGASRRSHLLTTRSMILGAFGTLDLEDRQLTLAPRDVLVLYTDGVTEASDRRGQLFGERRLRTVVTAHADRSADGIVGAISDAVDRFAGGVAPSDDLTLLVIKRRERASGGEGHATAGTATAR
jgi:serine phosphatase RsbU (regulator of sigma subunit)